MHDGQGGFPTGGGVADGVDRRPEGRQRLDHGRGRSAASTIISTSTLHEVRSAVRSGSSIALSAASRLSSASIRASSRAPKAGAPAQVTSWTVRYFTGDLLPGASSSLRWSLRYTSVFESRWGILARLGVDTVT